MAALGNTLPDAGDCEIGIREAQKEKFDEITLSAPLRYQVRVNSATERRLEGETLPLAYKGGYPFQHQTARPKGRRLRLKGA
jgi:hypothetical protein